MFSLVFALMAVAQSPEPTARPLYQTILDQGLVVGPTTVKLPPPCLRDGMTDPERKAALKAVVDLPLNEFLRDSVNAPFQIKIRDVPYPGGVVRVVDLWFAVHADLDEVNLDDLAGKEGQGGKTEAGNMSFSVRTLGEAELNGRPKGAEGSLDRFILSRGVLLDRIDVTTINHVVASKGGGALVIASLTDPSFKEGELASHWAPIPGPGDSKKDAGAPRPYEGSAGYSWIGRVSDKPSVLLVESHIAYAEPKAWFNGASILRSKFGLVAQDQIRKLRRELAARRKKGVEKP
jgi:hypothetical protein